MYLIFIFLTLYLYLLLFLEPAREPRSAEVITKAAPEPGQNTTSWQEVVFQAESHSLQWNCE